jgi:hypothetical protein
LYPRFAGDYRSASIVDADAEKRSQVKTQQQRQAEKRQEKLDEIEQQVKEGTLVIRKMTAAERKKFRPRSTAKPARKRS